MPALCGCTKRAPPPPGLTLPALPADAPLHLDLDFGDAVRLLGAKVEPAAALKPGSRVTLTLYWQRHAELDDDFRLFTHVLDEAGERILNLDDIGPLRKSVSGRPAFAPGAWDDELVYVDKLAFTVPYGVRTDSISVVAGLFREQERLPVTRGPKQGERGVVTELPIAQPIRRSSAVPILWLPRRRSAAPVTLDGKLDEGAWVTAASTGPFVNVATGEPPSAKEVAGSVKAMFDDQSLYLGFEVLDDDVRGGFDPSTEDPQLWTRDTVEVMIDPDGDGDGRDYYELQIGPQNLVFDSQFDAYNQPRQEPNGPFGHQEWSSRVKSAVEVRGTLDDQREDDGYVVEMAIPWSSFTKAKRTPPGPNDVWRMNFYVIQNNGGSAWSPILGQGNFHRASRFGRVRFAK